MTRLVGIDLSSNPAHGVVLEVAVPYGAWATRCISSVPLSPDNLDDAFQRAIGSADGSAAVIAPTTSLALSIALPFSDRKRVNALLPQELEDLLPFPSTEFTYGVTQTNSGQAAAALGAGAGSGRHQFHLQLAPKTSIREALDQLATLGVDPTIITPRSALLVPIAEALIAANEVLPTGSDRDLTEANLNNSPFPGSFFVLVPRAAQASAEAGGLELEADVLFVIDRRVAHHQPVHAIKTESGLSLSASLLLEVGNVYRRFNAEVSQGFVVLPPSIAARVLEIKAALSGTALKMEFHELQQLLPELPITAENETAVLAALCSIQGTSVGNAAASRPNGLAPSEPVNFRRGEFSYRPPLGELVRVARKLVRPALWTFGCACLCAAVLYVARDQEIAYLQRRIADGVYAVSPQLVASAGSELNALNDEALKMEQELRNIGTNDNAAPLELYIALTRHMPQLPDTSVDTVIASGNRIEVRGCAPSYRAIEQIENALTKVKIFANVKKGSAQNCSASGTGARGFTFVVTARE